MAANRVAMRHRPVGPRTPTHRPPYRPTDCPPTPVSGRCRRASANNSRFCHTGLQTRPPVVGGAPCCLRMHVRFNKKNPKRADESGERERVWHAPAMAEATRDDAGKAPNRYRRHAMPQTARIGGRRVTLLAYQSLYEAFQPSMWATRHVEPCDASGRLGVPDASCGRCARRAWPGATKESERSPRLAEYQPARQIHPYRFASRNARITGPISCTWLSNAKCPVS